MHMQLPTRPLFSALVLGAALGLACGGAGSQGQDEATPAVSDALGSAETAQGQDAQGAGTDKVAVCHLPPGNPANAHVIVVGAPAVKAHLAHGDVLGDCVTSGGTDTPDAGTGDSGGTPDGGTDGCVPEGGSCGAAGGACCDGLVCNGQSVCEVIIG